MDIYRIPIQLIYPLKEEGEFYYVFGEPSEYPGLGFESESLRLVAANHDGNLYTVVTNGIEWTGAFSDVFSEELKERLCRRFAIRGDHMTLYFSNNFQALEAVITAISSDS